MSEYQVTIDWRCGGSAFTDNRYSRAHRWLFDGGVEVPASSSPQIVPLPLSRADAVDPEEAFVASLASCHMLWFLSLAAERGYRVNAYRDTAVGVMGKNDEGKTAITKVTLRPHVEFSGSHRPDTAALRDLHEAAHDSCFLAASVKSQVCCEPVAD
jgi:organic hydroperoxide reductase OsmC/OhrA